MIFDREKEEESPCHSFSYLWGNSVKVRIIIVVRIFAFLSIFCMQLAQFLCLNNYTHTCTS